MTIPSDLLSVLVTYVSEQAFMWTGQEPQDRPAYYQEQGRQLHRLQQVAWEKAVPYGKEFEK